MPLRRAWWIPSTRLVQGRIKPLVEYDLGVGATTDQTMRLLRATPCREVTLVSRAEARSRAPLDFGTASVESRHGVRRLGATIG